MLEGSRPRWTTPIWCARPSADATWSPSAAARRHPSGPRSRILLSDSPGTYSITRIEQAVRLAVVGDLDDVGVVDAVDGARFAEEAFAPGRIAGELGVHDLDGAEPLDEDVPGEVHRRHRAGAEARDEPVALRDRAAEQRILRRRLGHRPDEHTRLVHGGTTPSRIVVALEPRREREACLDGEAPDRLGHARRPARPAGARRALRASRVDEAREARIGEERLRSSRMRRARPGLLPAGGECHGQAGHPHDGGVDEGAGLGPIDGAEERAPARGLGVPPAGAGFALGRGGRRDEDDGLALEIGVRGGALERA